MPEYVFFTDNSSEITPENCANLDIQRVNIGCNFEQSILSNLDDVDEFYAQLSLDNLAKTAAANPAQFMEAFEPVLDGGKDVLYFGLNSALSATFNSSLIAQMELADKYSKRRIVCLDSHCVSGGAGFLANEVANMRLAGESLDSVINHIETTKLNVIHDFSVNGLKYLKAGGRIGHWTAVIGDILQFRPLLYIDDEGRIEQASKERGAKKTFNAMVDKLENNIEDPSGIINIHHGACPDDAAYCAELILNRPALKHAQVSFGPDYRIGHVIGAHVGHGVIAFFYRGHHRGPLPKQV